MASGDVQWRDLHVWGVDAVEAPARIHSKDSKCLSDGDADRASHKSSERCVAALRSART